MKATVSVVIPVHNGAEVILNAINSVAQQTRLPLEIIVVDDASTDATVKTVEQAAARSVIPIQLVRVAVNGGPGNARNIGWNHAKGDLVAFLDADDLWHPQKLEIQVPIMEANPGVAISAHDRTVGAHTAPTPIRSTQVAWRQYGFGDFLVRNRCATPSVIVRRDIIQRFSPKLFRSEDYYLWLMLTRAHGPLRYADVALVHCANLSYGGAGLSGDLMKMYRGETLAMRLLTKDGYLPRALLPMVMTWSTLKFLVRLIDHRLLNNRVQTVSESR
jgi:glycosyltransferase involved in cell wall biosynthesis